MSAGLPNTLRLKIAAAAADACYLSPDLPLVVGVSGGPDSLCLAHALHRLNFLIIVAHFDHHLRPESSADAKSVQNWAQDHSIPFFLGEADVRSLAKSQRLSIEEAARTARYHYLFKLARQQSAQAVAVAHNADDQVETILMHLLRGAGLSGMRGMLPSSRIEGWDPSLPLVRPLLSVWRQEIEAYCRSENLAPIVDASNNDLTFFRNRLRHQLVPFLEGFNPQARAVIWRSGHILAGDAELIDSLVSNAWQTCLVEKNTGYDCLDWEGLRAQPLALQRGILRKAVNDLRPGLRDLDFEVIERAVRFLSKPSRSGYLDLSLGLGLFLEPPYLYLTEGVDILPLRPEWPQLAHPMELSIPGQVDIGRDWTIEARWGKSPENLSGLPADPWTAYLDANGVTLPFRIAPSQPGLRFQPLGMQGKSQKLSDFFINSGIPRRSRVKWPLLFSGEQIVWIPGGQPADHVRITPSTQQIVILRAFRS